MSGKFLSGRNWSVLLVVVLILPSLAISSFWVRESFETREKIRNTQAGLVEAAAPQEHLGHDFEMTSAQSPEVDQLLDPVITAFPPEQIDTASRHMDRIRERPTTVNATRLAQKLTTLQLQSTDLMAVAPPDVIILPYLFANQLLFVVINATLITETIERMTTKSEFNRWDRMAVPVTAGQFKESADQVTRTANDHINGATENCSPEIIEIAAALQKGSVALQSALGAPVMLMPVATTGTDLSTEKIIPANRQLIATTPQFWEQALQETLAHLNSEEAKRGGPRFSTSLQPC